MTCDADGIVVSLSLAGLGLQGPLPPALAQLGTLRLLNLSGNAFTGSLPAAWLAPDAFANLTSADLHSNRLGGGWGTLRPLLLLGLVPLQCCSPHNDSSCFVRGCPVSGPITVHQRTLPAVYCSGAAVLPDGLLSLASEVILLGSNLLNGSLPGNWQSSTLRVLGLGNNSLTGQLPSGWAMQGRLPALRELSLQANQLQGEGHPQQADCFSKKRLMPEAMLTLVWMHSNQPAPDQFWCQVVKLLTHRAGSVPAQYWTDGSFLPGLALAAEPGNPAVCGEESCHRPVCMQGELWVLAHSSAALPLGLSCVTLPVPPLPLLFPRRACTTAEP